MLSVLPPTVPASRIYGGGQYRRFFPPSSEFASLGTCHTFGTVWMNICDESIEKEDTMEWMEIVERGANLFHGVMPVTDGWDDSHNTTSNICQFSELFVGDKKCI